MTVVLVMLLMLMCCCRRRGCWSTALLLLRRMRISSAVLLRNSCWGRRRWASVRWFCWTDAGTAPGTAVAVARAAGELVVIAADGCPVMVSCGPVCSLLQTILKKSLTFRWLILQTNTQTDRYPLTLWQILTCIFNVYDMFYVCMVCDMQTQYARLTVWNCNVSSLHKYVKL